MDTRRFGWRAGMVGAVSWLGVAGCSVADLPPLPTDAGSEVRDTSAGVDVGNDLGEADDVDAHDEAGSDVLSDVPSEVAPPDAAPDDDAPEGDADLEDATDADAPTADADEPDASAPDGGVDVSPDAPPANPDFVDASCLDPGWIAGPCEPGVTTEVPATAPALHIALPEPIVYTTHPPSSGPHRGHWAVWGEYEFLPPQIWVHNLEHGGIALLYNPCGDPANVDALRQIAQARPGDDGGPFRWVLTPYPDLPSAIAVVAWEATWAAECVDADEIGAFIDAHYRKGPEDIASDGAFSIGWLGK